MIPISWKWRYLPGKDEVLWEDYKITDYDERSLKTIPKKVRAHESCFEEKDKQEWLRIIKFRRCIYEEWRKRMKKRSPEENNSL